MQHHIKPKAGNNQAIVACTYQNRDYEGFRPYEGESDIVNIRKLFGPKRYALCVAICSENKTNHHIFVVIDTNHHITIFQNFLAEHMPNVKYTRYLRSRT